MSDLRVAVAGGGLGGLCLAQGLLKAEAGTGMRHNRLVFWLYRRLTGTSA